MLRRVWPSCRSRVALCRLRQTVVWRGSSASLGYRRVHAALAEERGV